MRGFLLWGGGRDDLRFLSHYQDERRRIGKGWVFRRDEGLGDEGWDEREDGKEEGTNAETKAAPLTHSSRPAHQAE